jgi:transposase InsO family protein
VARFKAEGRAGMQDRSSRPQRLNRPTPPGTIEQIVALRRQRFTGKHIARELKVSAATVSRVLRRAGLSRMRDLEPAQPIRRYQYDEPGELIHIDIKKLGRFDHVGHRITGDRRGESRSRGIGWEYVHVAIDDHTRLAYVEVLPDQRGPACRAFLERAVAWYHARGITCRRLLTDNGSGYLSRAFREGCVALGLRHRRTRPYTPRTNGKAERFIQTLLREWAYAMPYATSQERRRALRPWVRFYNRERPHASLGYQPPLTRLQRAA